MHMLYVDTGMRIDVQLLIPIDHRCLCRSALSVIV